MGRIFSISDLEFPVVTGEVNGFGAFVEFGGFGGPEAVLAAGFGGVGCQEWTVFLGRLLPWCLLLESFALGFRELCHGTRFLVGGVCFRF